MWAGVLPVVLGMARGAAEPIPETAFVAESAPPARTPVPVLAAPAAPTAGGDDAFQYWVNLQNKPEPFYRRWWQSVFSLVAPGEPYRRDKLVLSFGTSLGYDDNVLYSATNKIGSSVAGVNGVIDYHFGSRRLKLDANLGAGISYYENRPGGSDDRNVSLTLGADYQVNRRLGLGFHTRSSYLSQPSPQLVGGIFSYVGSYFATDTSLQARYQLRPRLGLSLGYTYNAIRYEDELINEGSGFYQQTFSLSGNWLLSPRTSLIIQYRYNPVNYYESGISSTGQFLLTGLEQSLSPQLRYTFLFGAEHRALENPDPNSPSSYLGPFAEGSLRYQFAPRSQLEGSLRLGTEPSGTSGVTIRQTFRAGLSANHFIGSRLSFTIGVGYEVDRYDQPGIADFTQDIYTASVALRYEIAFYTAVVLRDDYLMLESSTPNGSYSRNYVSIGLEATF
jgi:hypothetical protein